MAIPDVTVGFCSVVGADDSHSLYMRSFLRPHCLIASMQPMAFSYTSLVILRGALGIGRQRLLASHICVILLQTRRAGGPGSYHLSPTGNPDLSCKTHCGSKREFCRADSFCDSHSGLEEAMLTPNCAQSVISAAPLATPFANSLTWVISKIGTRIATANWRLLFLVEGFPSIVVSVLVSL